MANTSALLVVLSLLLPGATSLVGAQTGLPPDSVVRQLAASRLAWGLAPGLIVGLLDADGTRRFVAVGRSSGPGSRPIDSTTVFEIGSITKTFTGSLLAEMVARGEVRLEDPVAKYLPSDVRVPSRNGRMITLLDLATHTSGLPGQPANLRPVAGEANPYADYSSKDLYQFLSGYQLARDPGTQYEYSNLGFALLGHAVARRMGISYEALLAERILRPPGLNDTRITFSPSMRLRVAVGYNHDNDSVGTYDFDVYASAGALRSTATDLLTLISKHLAQENNGMTGILRDARQPRRGVSSTPGDSVALGWHTLRKNPVGGQPLPDSHVLVQHSGQTGGYYTFMGFDPVRRIGVVVLSNSSYSIRDLGLHLLDSAIPLYNKPPAWPREIAVDTVTLQRYVGEYASPAGERTTILRVGSRLYAQVSGQDRYRIFPGTDSTFYWKRVVAQVSFFSNGDGSIGRMVTRQGGRETEALRVK
jgi:serine-type D-Ala-D-Ala carboxypeptidase/endopeptidase